MTIRVEIERRPKHTVRKYQGNEEIGHGSIIIDYKEEGKPAALIEDVWTHEDYRKQGIGSEIVCELIRIADEEGCYKICLHCSDINTHFYKRLGFNKWQNSMRLNLNQT